ncbi:hypothetical protein FALBO_10191 [Fusarium albosuccineum]|uniref:Uncharacterized protein n=1 Tax=Fusarium albosuccineum TaxID=1237068 RepID=A0A8H4L666_9HYPO|nr:hypothetical protein FALBO_10191 [Fusarium albosuccineum]
MLPIQSELKRDREICRASVFPSGREDLPGAHRVGDRTRPEVDALLRKIETSRYPLNSTPEMRYGDKEDPATDDENWGRGPPTLDKFEAHRSPSAEAPSAYRRRNMTEVGGSA